MDYTHNGYIHKIWKKMTSQIDLVLPKYLKYFWLLSNWCNCYCPRQLSWLVTESRRFSADAREVVRYRRRQTTFDDCDVLSCPHKWKKKQKQNWNKAAEKLWNVLEMFSRLFQSLAYICNICIAVCTTEIKRKQNWNKELFHFSRPPINCFISVLFQFYFNNSVDSFQDYPRRCPSLLSCHDASPSSPGAQFGTNGWCN